MGVMDKLRKNSKIKKTEVLSSSSFFGEKDEIVTNIPMMNVALSARFDGGMQSGLLILAGPSKHFKSSFGLVMAAAFQKKYPDGVVLFYDSEFGSPESYFRNFGVDPDRVLHTPITNIEELKFDLMGQMENLDTNDKVMVLIDSVGNLPSKKEVEDALNEKSVADMTRAKAFKSLFRMLTPQLALKDIPAVVINHTYKEIGMFPKDIVSGGTGIMYSANDVWIIGRRQVKEKTEVTGYEFVITIEKSRKVREKSKIPIKVTWDGGIDPDSGLFDVALAGGFLNSPSSGWYQLVDTDTGELVGTKMRKTDIPLSDLLTNEKFIDFVFKSYTIDKGGDGIDLDLEVE